MGPFLGTMRWARTGTHEGLPRRYVPISQYGVGSSPFSDFSLLFFYVLSSPAVCSNPFLVPLFFCTSNFYLICPNSAEMSFNWQKRGAAVNQVVLSTMTDF
jgi:hypothetical protein